MLATSCGNVDLVQKLGDLAKEKNINNISFLSNFILGDKHKALENLIQTDRLPEAAFFARTYLPSQVARVISLWKESVTLKTKNEKAAQALADPFEYENLFPDFAKSLAAEKYYKENYEDRPRPKANEYLNQIPNIERNLLDEIGDGEFNLDDYKTSNRMSNGFNEEHQQLDRATENLGNLRIDNSYESHPQNDNLRIDQDDELEIDDDDGFGQYKDD